MTPTPFSLEIPQADIEDLKTRLTRTRLPDQAPDAPWAYGTDLSYMRDLISWWRDRFDWRKQEARLNAFPQFKVPLHGIDLHFIRVEGKGPAPMPLLLMHGWPGSVFEFMEIIPRLTDPARFGGDPRDAFTVIAPSLPGFGLSFRPGQPRFSIEQIADCLHDLMRNVLGYARFGVQGGDYGAFTATRLGVAYPAPLAGIHLNFLVVRRDLPVPTEPSREERIYFDDLARWTKMETGYQQIQGTKPQTLAYGLTDSPAGLAAWLVEKLRTWSDCDGDVESVHSRDSILANAFIGSPLRSAPLSGPITRGFTMLGRSPMGRRDGSDRICRVPEGDHSSTAIDRRDGLRQSSTLDTNDQGRSLRGDGATRRAGSRYRGFLPRPADWCGTWPRHRMSCRLACCA